MSCNYMSYDYHKTTLCFSGHVAEYLIRIPNQHWQITEASDESILQLLNAISM